MQFGDFYVQYTENRKNIKHGLAFQHGVQYALFQCKSLLHPMCTVQVLTCMSGCFGQDDEAACQFICQWELGQANQKYLNLLKCMGEHHCLSMQPDGICFKDSR